MPNYDAGLASGYVLRLSTSQDAQSVNGNYSVVGWHLHIIKGSGSGKWADGPHYWSVNIGGHTASGSIPSYNFQNYSVLTLGSGQFTIGHNADGTQSIGVSGGWDDNNTWGELGDGSVGGGMGLTTIPRATTANFTNPMIMGNAYTINTPRASASFTHQVEYYFGSASGVIATGVGTSVAWTPPTSLASQIPNNASGTGIIRVHTYSGATYIGYRDTSLTLTVPASMVPDFTTITHAEATAGVAANIGAYVQGISKLALAITGAAGVSGSTISSYKIEVAGQTINAASGTTPSPISLGGTVSLIGTVTDSRGRTKSKTVNITILPYLPPNIISISGVRSTAAGVPADEGTYVRVNINASVQSLLVTTERNAINYKIYSRLRGDTTWVLKDTTTPGGIVFNDFEAIGTYSIEQAFEFRVEIYDDFSTTALQFTVATAAIFQHWDGKDGVGVGKYRQFGMLDVLGEIYHRDGLAVLDETSLDLSAVKLDPAYQGPGKAKVVINGVLSTEEYDWLTPYKPWGNRAVTLFGDGVTQPRSILGHSGAEFAGGMKRVPMLANWTAYFDRAGGPDWAPTDNDLIAVRTIDGIVNLSGLFIGGTATVNTTVAILPEGFRPDMRGYFPINNSDIHRGIYIEPTGEIKIGITMTAGSYISLDNISFPAAGVATWTDIPAFTNGWVSFHTGDAAYPPAGYWVDSYGVTWLRGMIKSGTVGSSAFILPAGVRPAASWSQHLVTVASGAFGYLFAQHTDGAVIPRIGTNGWFSLDGVTIMTDAAKSGLDWYDPTMVSGWLDYGVGYPSGWLTKRADGLVFSSGLIKSGTVAARAFLVPDRYSLPRSTLRTAVSADARGRLDMTGRNDWEAGIPPQSFMISQGSTSWFSLDSQKWYPY